MSHLAELIHVIMEELVLMVQEAFILLSVSGPVPPQSKRLSSSTYKAINKISQFTIYGLTELY